MHELLSTWIKKNEEIHKLEDFCKGSKSMNFSCSMQTRNTHTHKPSTTHAPRITNEGLMKWTVQNSLLSNSTVELFQQPSSTAGFFCWSFWVELWWCTKFACSGCHMRTTYSVAQRRSDTKVGWDQEIPPLLNYLWLASYSQRMWEKSGRRGPFCDETIMYNFWHNLHSPATHA